MERQIRETNSRTPALRLRRQKPFKRGHGILMPVFSLPGAYGIGTLGREAYAFVDFLARAGCAFWQVLPLGPTGYGDSPYQCFSAFAGNPYLIDPGLLYENGLLTKAQAEGCKMPAGDRVDYGQLYQIRRQQLQQAFSRFAAAPPSGLEAFSSRAFWLEDYADFMALKARFGQSARTAFPEFRLKSKRAHTFVSENLRRERAFTVFLEYVFYEQWCALKAYANKKGVQIIGDIPLYVSGDSADVWANPELFLLDAAGNPTDVAGVPPDMFSADGQLWGNPLYRWEAHAAENYDWWKRRIFWQSELFDVIRIDHFIGISRYYSIPAEETTARNGVWLEGPDRALIAAFGEAAPKTAFIAEDLGVVSRATERLMKAAGYPGMRLLQFAFDGDGDNGNLLHNIPKNAVAYTGTHDNSTTRGFFEACPAKTRRAARRYLGVARSRELPGALLREVLKSPANTAIIGMWDYLGLDDCARINTPATVGGNWCWRMQNQPDNLLADEIAAQAAIYKRER